MPEFLQLMAPDEALRLLLAHVRSSQRPTELILTAQALGRVTAEDIRAPHALPEFPRSTVDGYAVKARDTFGASDGQPGYLALTGEVPMGAPASIRLRTGDCALIHTGGMLPEGADAVVMIEHTQAIRGPSAEGTTLGEVEVLRAVAPGENTIAVGEDVKAGSTVIEAGRRIRPAEVGGLMALGITDVRVATKPTVAIISSGDEVVEPDATPGPGQVRDVNAYTLAALSERYGGSGIRYGIVPDDKKRLAEVAREALAACDVVVITAGSSASVRDMTAEIIDGLGRPGVLVHGVNTRPGKPTILGACEGKAVIGLPGNPVSALVNGYLFVKPVIERLLGAKPEVARASIRARLTLNLASQAGREDWWPVKLGRGEGDEMQAEPIFGKSNLIFTLAAADGLLRIAPAATGLDAGQIVEVYPL